eukprot:TRINITY_DN2840_c0_g1_i5.p1 TRINITY_DN2840_c0_g1~~TRINITY_DN2840_c0_g1_i5.p1  ORF type:complete len:427 (+),score=72.58 TRINITY_DN2840_c0_g1_i5:493-1773(+)
MIPLSSVLFPFCDPKQLKPQFSSQVVRLKKSPKVLNEIHGPVDVQDPQDFFAQFIWARAVSTYPFLPTKGARDGDPVVDGYLVRLLEDDAGVAVVTDGCNWGPGPLEASNIAKRAFADYMMTHLHEIQEVRDAGHYLLDAISYCHHKICEGHPTDIWSAGTTTLCGGVLLKLKPPKEISLSSPQWAFVSVSIGDCKAFHYSMASGNMIDLTAGNRKHCRDATDCGGRLGPYLREGEPDLRNVQVSYSVCQEDDLILIVTDGVHDNFDPQMLGKRVDTFGQEYVQYSSWDDLKDVDERESLKEMFMIDQLISLIENADDSELDLRKKVFAYDQDKQEHMLPTALVNRIVRHCLSITGAGREWMEQNPVAKLPSDYVKYPGKMDHATVAVLRVAPVADSLLREATVQKLSLRSSGGLSASDMSRSAPR